MKRDFTLVKSEEKSESLKSKVDSKETSRLKDFAQQQKEKPQEMILRQPREGNNTKRKSDKIHEGKTTQNILLTTSFKSLVLEWHMVTVA